MGGDTAEHVTIFVIGSIVIEKRINDPSWMNIAFSEIGVAEILGDENHVRIQEYTNTCTGQALPDHIPWCSAFINWVMIESKLGGTNSMLAKSWLRYGVPVPTPSAEFGCIAVLKRGTKSWQGHCGFLVGQTKESVFILGGNQSDAVNIKPFCPDDIIQYRAPFAWAKERFLS